MFGRVDEHWTPMPRTSGGLGSNEFQVLNLVVATMTQLQHPKLPSVLPSVPALQDGIVCYVDGAIIY